MIYFTILPSNTSQNFLTSGIQYSNDTYYVGQLPFQISSTVPTDPISGQPLILSLTGATNYVYYNATQTVDSGLVSMVNYVLKIKPNTFYSYNFKTCEFNQFNSKYFFKLLILILFNFIAITQPSAGTASFCSVVLSNIGNNLPCVSSLIRNQSYQYTNLLRTSDTAYAGVLCNTSKKSDYFFFYF